MPSKSQALSGRHIDVDPVLVVVSDALHISGLSRSALYRKLAAGEIEAVKSGTRTLVVVASLRAHLANLPLAKIGRTP